MAKHGHELEMSGRRRRGGGRKAFLPAPELMKKRGVEFGGAMASMKGAKRGRFGRRKA